MMRDNIVELKLNTLHKDAEGDFSHIQKAVENSPFHSLQPSDFKNAYLPISQEQGQYLRQLIIENSLKTVVEFGTSFGISTIYLADGVHHTGGRVITTELVESKADRALKNLVDVELEKLVEIKIGDALETLKDFSLPIDLLFLDGWKNLYLPLFKMLEPNLHNGSFIYADNMYIPETKQFEEYILSHSDKYELLPMHNKNAILIIQMIHKK